MITPMIEQASMRADWDIVAIRRVRNLIGAWRPRLVHAHDARAHAIAMAALVGIQGVPLIVTRRVVFVPHGRVKYGNRVARFIAISRAVAHALVQGGVAPIDIDVVYSGVPAPELSQPRDWRTELGWPAESVILGVVGAMTAEKGIERLAAITQHLPTAIAQRIRVVLLGGQARGHTTLGHVSAFSAGFVDDIHPAMAGLDVLLHPSRAEGLGTAVIDAMALGVPPIAFAVGGLPELIEPERSGLLVRLGDHQAFAESIDRLVSDPTLRSSLGSAGRARATRFGVDQMIDGTLAVYQRVLQAALAK